MPALTQGEVAALALAEPAVVVDGPFEVAQTSQHVDEAVRAVVKGMVLVCLRVVDLRQAMRLCQDNDGRKLGVDTEATVRQRDGPCLSLVDGLLMRQDAVHLLIHDGLALRWVADSYARDASEGVRIGILPRLRLCAARIDATRHLPADHTYFVEDNEVRSAKVVLERM